MDDSHRSEDVLGRSQRMIMEEADTLIDTSSRDGATLSSARGAPVNTSLQSSGRSDADEPDFFQTAEQEHMKHALKEVHQMSARFDRDCFQQKRQARETWRNALGGGLNEGKNAHFSTLLRKLPVDEGS